MKIALPTILLVLAWMAWRAWQTGPLPKIGTPAPDFSLPDQHGDMHRPSAY